MKTGWIPALAALLMACNTCALEPAGSAAAPAQKAEAGEQAPAVIRSAPAHDKEGVFVLPEKHVRKLPDLCDMKSGGPARQATHVSMRWSQTCLEVVFDCEDNPRKTRFQMFNRLMKRGERGGHGPDDRMQLDADGGLVADERRPEFIAGLQAKRGCHGFPCVFDAGAAQDS